MVPVTGIFVMMLGAGAPLWISLVVNAMLLHVGLSAFSAGNSRWRLLLPILAYGAYFGAIAAVRHDGIQQIEHYERGSELSEVVSADTPLVFEDRGDRPLAAAVMRLSTKHTIFVGIFRLVIKEVPRTTAGYDCFKDGRLGYLNSPQAPVSQCIDLDFVPGGPL